MKNDDIYTLVNAFCLGRFSDDVENLIVIWVPEGGVVDFAASDTVNRWYRDIVDVLLQQGARLFGEPVRATDFKQLLVAAHFYGKLTVEPQALYSLFLFEGEASE